MPKYSGIIELKGTFGKLSFYKRKGVDCVRRPGGFTKEQLQTDPRLRRVRAHTGEFGAQSMASKSLRTALAPVKNFCDGSFHNRLMRIGARVTALTEGVYGQRPVAFSRIKPILNDLQLNADRTLESSLVTSVNSISSSARNSAKLQLNFDVPTAVSPPNGATHFRLTHTLGVISDIEYDPALGGFIPVAYQVDGKSSISRSEYISLAQEGSASIRLETALSIDEVPGNASVVEVLGITFYLLVGHVHEPMEAGRAGKIVRVF